MSILYALTVGVRNLRRFPLRSVLSMLGMVIGIVAVSLVVALGEAAQGSILRELTAFGTNIVRINTKVPGLSTFGTASARVQGVQVTTFKFEQDVRPLLQFPFVEAVSGYTTAQEWIVAGNKEKRALILCATADYQAVDAQTIISEGRFFTDQEERGAARVIVLGEQVRRTLFGDGDLGTVRIGSATYTAIGGLAPRGATFGFNFDDLVMMPLRTCQQLVLGVDFIEEAGVKIAAGTTEEEAKRAIEAFIRRRHGITDASKDDFEVTTTDQAIGIATLVTDVMQALLLLLAGISLLVGGVGIMNIMLVSVSERLNEIGIRLAVGARRQDIFRQFVLESVVLTSLGGALGVAITGLLLLLVHFGLRAAGFDWDITFPLSSVLASMSLSMALGIVFGVYPARKASRLEPITALRTM